MRLLLLIATATAGLALFNAGASEAAGPPSPSDTIVLAFEEADTQDAFIGGRISDRCPLGEQRIRVFYADGRAAGTASICLLRSLGVPYSQFWSAVITVHVAGGSVTATIGTSLTWDFGSGFPYYTDPATGYCVLGYGFGGGTSFELMGCEGPITGATGIYAQASGGWLALTWAWQQLEQPGAEVVWTTTPTITITFS